MMITVVVLLVLILLSVLFPSGMRETIKAIGIIILLLAAMAYFHAQGN